MARLTVKQDNKDHNFSVLDKVLVGTTQEPGAIKFIGPTHFSPGEWVGVELEKAVGKNDGAVQDTKYFECKNNHGLFVRKTALAPAVIPTKQVAAAKAKGKAGTSRPTVSRAGSAAKMEPSQQTAAKSPRDSTNSRPATDPQSPASSSALASLRTASEERDVDKLQVAIKNALQASVSPEEIQRAQEILSSQSQKVLSKEFERIRSVVSGLTESVRITQARVSAAESSGPDSVWVASVVERIEQRAWQALEQKIEDRIQIAVRNVSAELMSRGVGSGIPQGSGSEAQEKIMQAAFQAFDVDKDGEITRAEFQKILQNAGTTRSATMDTNGAAPDQPLKRIAEEAEVSQSSGKERSEEAASKMPSLSRGGSVESSDIGSASKEEALRQKARSSLVQGLRSGSLAGATENAKVLRDTTNTTNATDRESVLKQRARQGLVEGLQNGVLEGTVNNGKVSRASKGEGQGVRDRERELRQKAKSGLVGGLKDGSLKESIAKSASRQSLRKSSAGNEGKDIKAALDPEKAALKIQRWWRRRRIAIKANPVSATVRRAQWRNAEWCKAFQECLPSHSTTGLDEEAFDKALQKVLPGRAASGQARALIKGYLEGTGRSEMDLMGFLSVAEAVTLGPAAAAEYADINIDTYAMLGKEGADSAASKIGSLARGRSARSQAGVSASAKSGVGSVSAASAVS